MLLFALTVDARVGWDSCLIPFAVYTKNTILYVHYSVIFNVFCFHIAVNPLVTVSALRRKSACCMTWFVPERTMRWDTRYNENQSIKRLSIWLEMTSSNTSITDEVIFSYRYVTMVLLSGWPQKLNPISWILRFQERSENFLNTSPEKMRLVSLCGSDFAYTVGEQMSLKPDVTIL